MTFSVLHKFCSDTALNCADGSLPLGVIEATDASLYGVTVHGGLGTSDCGTINRIAEQGMLRTLHAFDQVDGCGPATLVQATDGNFYGVTGAGGSSGWGTIFSITPAGKMTTLHTFCAQTTAAGQTVSCQFDGAIATGLFQATDGKFYGSTYQGGATGSGTVFRLDLRLEPFVSFAALPVKSARFAASSARVSPERLQSRSMELRRSSLPSLIRSLKPSFPKGRPPAMSQSLRPPAC